MNTYWVYENIRKQVSYYTKLDILLLFSSATLWKKNHPTFTNILHVDQITYDYIKKCNALNIWDKVEIIPENKFIDKNVFWASAKLQTLRYVNGPSIIMDHDFLVYTNLDSHLQDKIIVAVEENGDKYYPTAYDEFMRAVKHKLKRPKLRAINCSFLYFPNHEFVNEYAKRSLELMDEFTKLKAPNSRYLIVAEQMLLKHMLDENNIEYDSLMKAEWNCHEKVYTQYNKGIYDLEICDTKFRHYWMDKNKIKESKEGFNYQEEIRILKNILSTNSDINFNEIDNLKY